MKSSKILVTKSYLPSKKRYIQYVKRIFKSHSLTNFGENVIKLENELKKFLNIKNILLTANGELALEVAMRLLKIKGEVITTPFSFVATTNSILINGLIPKFVDIDDKTFNINTLNIEKGINRNTELILPVHVFGNPCDVEDIENISNKYNLKVIYDAAHAFAVKYKNNSVLNFGDISILSFHATKIFHTIEGGALIINDENLYEEAKELINFGISNKGEINSCGTNAKMNEFEAAMGLCILNDIDKVISRKKEIFELYKYKLSDIVEFQILRQDIKYNYSYCPILVKNEKELLKLIEKLNQENIFPRRYFYPSLNTLKYLKNYEKMKISEDISSRILCLPTYVDLKEKDQLKIIKIIKESLK